MISLRICIPAEPLLVLPGELEQHDLELHSEQLRFRRLLTLVLLGVCLWFPTVLRAMQRWIPASIPRLEQSYAPHLGTPPTGIPVHPAARSD